TWEARYGLDDRSAKTALLRSFRCAELSNSLLLGRRLEQLRDRKIAAAARRADLAPGAVLRILVGAEADEPRAVPEAVLLELVVANFADELRLDRVPVELLAAGPAALAARHAVAADRAGRAQLRQLRLELAAHVGRKARAVADEFEAALVAVEPEQQRRDPSFGLVAPAEADDHTVGGA